MKMKTQISSFLFLVILFSACKTKNTESVIGKWSIISITPIDSTSSKSVAEIAALGFLNNMTSGGIIEYYENGEYEIKKDTSSLEKGKFSVIENSIIHSKVDGLTEKNTLIFKNISELEIKSTSMILSLKRN
jgi:hypothetical protein